MTPRLERLRDEVDSLARIDASSMPPETERVITELRNALASGDVRAAVPVAGGDWEVQSWVKRGILLAFRVGRTQDLTTDIGFPFFDKHTLPTSRLALEHGVRVVPGGSAIRDGAFIAPGVICMPPMYVNIGAYIGPDSMIDSHVLVGSCAQIGARVHLSAGVQIGGVLEPVGARPVIVEDDVLIGGNCGIFEGTLVGPRAVLAPGTMLTRSTRVYDLVHERTLAGSAEEPLSIPPGAVVVPGSRPAAGDFASRQGVQLYAPVIVKYRDEGTNAAVALEEALR